MLQLGVVYPIFGSSNEGTFRLYPLFSTSTHEFVNRRISRAHSSTMPSFAELRAKAEAAANSAKSTANSKLAAYRGDEQQQQPAKPVYNPPRPRPTVKPDIPQATRPPAPDHEQADTQADDTTALVESDLSPEIQTLINNKALFFEFLDEVCT